MTAFSWQQLVILVVTFAVVGCTTNNRSERVIERYSNGQKKVVAVYHGEGRDEELLRRTTYAKNGERLKVENVQSGKVKNYGDLHPEYANSDSLRNFLTGSIWDSSSDIENMLFYFENDSIHTKNIQDDTIIVNSYKANYGDNLTVKGYNEGSYKKFKINIITKDTITLESFDAKYYRWNYKARAESVKFRLDPNVIVKDPSWPQTVELDLK